MCENRKCIQSVLEEEAFIGEGKKKGVGGSNSSVEATQHDVGSTPETSLDKEGSIFISTYKGDEIEDMLSMCNGTIVQVNVKDVGCLGRMSCSLDFQKEIWRAA